MRKARIGVVTLVMLMIAAAVEAQTDALEWTPLFDGKTTTGWRQAGAGAFLIRDGELISNGGMGLIYTDRPFGDFVLKLQYKTTRRQDNSGVFLRFPYPGNDAWVAVNQGHEVQICDTDAQPTGSVYGFSKITDAPTRPPGEWNDLEIRAVGRKYTITLNGQTINQLLSDRGTEGHIGLQNHDGSTVSFRNIQIRELAPGEAALTPMATGDLQSGLVGEYFRQIDGLGSLGSAKEPFLVRVDRQLDFDDANGQFHGSKLDVRFGVRWNGFLRVEEPGTYVFSLRSDDGSRLYIGEELVIDNARGEPMEPASGDVELRAGDYPIRVEFEQGLGGAGIILAWQPPGAERISAIPAWHLFHEEPQSQIAWDEKAWKDYTWDRRTWARQYGPAWEKMEYGSILSATIHAPFPEGNTTNKAIAIDLGDNAYVLFDTETMRYAAGWTGDFLRLEGVAFNGAHGPNPSIAGEQIFGTRVGPGWAGPDGQWDDPRPNQLGPLPREWAKYKGLYRHGDRVVLSYSVGGTDVLESPGVKQFGDKIVFTRAFKIAPHRQPLQLLISEKRLPDGAQVGVFPFIGISDIRQEENGPILLNLEPSDEAWTFEVGTLSAHPDEPDVDAKMELNAPRFDQLVGGGSPQWPEIITTQGTLGEGDGPYVVDTLTLPDSNPYNSWMRIGGFDFFSDGTRAALCTWSGDVWIVSGIDDSLQSLKWKRYAAGLFQTLGLRIVDDQIYVLGRDQITRLHDLNNDGEADFYENFNNDCQVSASFHEFALDLQTDPQGNFYFAKGGPVRPGGRGWETITDHNGCVLRVSRDGSKLEVFATGVRAPNGMGASPDGLISVADNEGTWMPTGRLSIVREGDFLGTVDLDHDDSAVPEDYDKPLCWIPLHSVDNSPGGQVWVTSDRWGPFAGQMLHTSYGTCSLFAVLKEQIDGEYQGGLVRFPLDFASGICRARFSPRDGQLYVTGLRGWQTRAARDGCFQRVRYTGKPVQMPAVLNVHGNGLTIGFTTDLDADAAGDIENYAIEQWNYIWSKEYGSPEVSVVDPSDHSHDPMEVVSATLSEDRRSVFLEVPDLEPVMQMKITMSIKGSDGSLIEYDIHNTINALGPDVAIAGADEESATEDTENTEE